MDLQAILSSIEGVQVRTTQHQTTYATVAREQFARVAYELDTIRDLPLAVLYGTDNRAQKQGFGVHAVFAVAANHAWIVLSTMVPADDPRYPSLTPTIMAAHWYERYLMDMFGVEAVGHPDPRRLVHHENVPEGTYPLRKDFAWNTKLDHADVPYPMHHIEGEGIYEIPVGPIHAGVIEPGHFRFNVAGERIITLEGKLFFTHKGVEKLLEGKTIEEALPFVERISGDAAVSHTLAFAQAVESIASCTVPLRARALRIVVGELERITMHVHDLSNIAGMGTGYSLMSSQGFRVKERLVRLSDALFGNRFWRGFVVPGGCARDIYEEEVQMIRTTVRDVGEEMQDLLRIALASDGMRERLETTGVLPFEAARAFGARGIAARASGLDRDVRRDHPYAAYTEYPIPVVHAQGGDIYARYIARAEELLHSIALVEHVLSTLKNGSVHTACVAASGVGLSAVESWRGEIVTIVHMAGNVIDRFVARDPSFCNWALFGILGPGNIVPDFPLCNKSLNLSYSGNDL